MKHLLLVLLFIVPTVLWGQEVTHEHSIHHAFTENKGQWNERILFKSQFDGGNLWVQKQKMVFHLQYISAIHDARAAPNIKTKYTEPGSEERRAANT